MNNYVPKCAGISHRPQSSDRPLWTMEELSLYREKPGWTMGEDIERRGIIDNNGYKIETTYRDITPSGQVIPPLLALPKKDYVHLQKFGKLKNGTMAAGSNGFAYRFKKINDKKRLGGKAPFLKESNSPRVDYENDREKIIADYGLYDNDENYNREVVQPGPDNEEINSKLTLYKVYLVKALSAPPSSALDAWKAVEKVRKSIPEKYRPFGQSPLADDKLTKNITLQRLQVVHLDIKDELENARRKGATEDELKFLEKAGLIYYMKIRDQCKPHNKPGFFPTVKDKLIKYNIIDRECRGVWECMGDAFKSVGAAIKKGFRAVWDHSFGYIVDAVQWTWSKMKKAFRATAFGRWCLKVKEGVVKFATKVLQPIAKVVAKVAPAIAPVAAIIPGVGPALAGALVAIGGAAAAFVRYSVPIIKAIKVIDGKKVEVKVPQFESLKQYFNVKMDMLTDAMKVDDIKPEEIKSIQAEISELKNQTWDNVKELNKSLREGEEVMGEIDSELDLEAQLPKEDLERIKKYAEGIINPADAIGLTESEKERRIKNALRAQVERVKAERRSLHHKVTGLKRINEQLTPQQKRIIAAAQSQNKIKRRETNRQVELARNLAYNQREALTSLLDAVEQFGFKTEVKA